MSQYTDPTQHFFWLSSRALGIVAVILLAASVTLGLSMTAKLMRKPGMASKVRNIHEALALAAVAAIAGHGLLLLGDKFINADIKDILVPFAMHGQPFWTGIGIIGGWLTAIFTFSFYVRRWIGTKTWRKLHRFTLAAYVLAVVHTIGSGTDAGTPWMIVLLIAITTPVLFGLTAKLVSGSRNSRPGGGRPPKDRRPLPTLDAQPVQRRPLQGATR